MNLFEVMTGPIARMSYVSRYSSFPANRRENVAEHSWWVAFIAMLIGKDLYYNHKVDVKLETLMLRAVLHDISECMSGDVIRSYKHKNEDIRDAMAEADGLATEELVVEWGGVGNSVRHFWASAKADDIEGEIVAFADMASVVFYCREEDRSGNRAIRPVLAEAYEKWFHKFHEHPLLGRYMLQIFPEGRWPDALREESVTARTMYPGHPMLFDHSEGPVAEMPELEAREV